MTETPRSSRCGRLHQAVYSRSVLRSSIWRVGSPTPPSRAAPLERDAHRFDRLLVDLLVWALGAAGALAPLAGWALTSAHSRASRALGLRSRCSGTPMVPMSWKRAPSLIAASSSSEQPRVVATCTA